MCGITGYYNFNGQAEKSNDAIRKMLLLQKHRGPDDSGIVAINTSNSSYKNIPFDHTVTFTEPSDLILGFNRLSILDLSSHGHQPMVSL